MTFSIEYLFPDLLYAGITAIAISAGELHTCSVLNGGSVMCWGSNINGQLGLSTRNTIYTPASVDLGPGRKLACD